MPLFRCKHHVPTKENIIIVYDCWTVDWNFVYGLKTTYQGFCSECDCYVTMTERTESQAMYESYRSAAEISHVPQPPPSVVNHKSPNRKRTTT